MTIGGTMENEDYLLSLYYGEYSRKPPRIAAVLYDGSEESRLVLRSGKFGLSDFTVNDDGSLTVGGTAHGDGAEESDAEDGAQESADGTETEETGGSVGFTVNVGDYVLRDADGSFSVASAVDVMYKLDRHTDNILI